MKFIIDRSLWYRGHGNESSRLFRPSDGMRCCIGFVGQQIGIPDKQLDRGGVTSFITRKCEAAWPDWMKLGSGDIFRAYSLNDNQEITDELREIELKKIFERHGDELEFIDPKPAPTRREVIEKALLKSQWIAGEYISPLAQIIDETLAEEFDNPGPKSPACAGKVIQFPAPGGCVSRPSPSELLQEELEPLPNTGLKYA